MDDIGSPKNVLMSSLVMSALVLRQEDKKADESWLVFGTDD